MLKTAIFQYPLCTDLRFQVDTLQISPNEKKLPFLFTGSRNTFHPRYNIFRWEAFKPKIDHLIISGNRHAVCWESDQSMTTPLLEHIGKRIRLYRNAKNINIETFSKLIHKSKATVSKYERGQIVIDISTLFEIAHALQIDINQLIDFPFPAGAQKNPPIPNPFEANTIFMYIFDGRVNRLVRSVIEVHENAIPPQLTATLYYNVESYEDLSGCEYLYFGVMRPFDTIVNLVLENQSNPIEQVLINVVRPLKKTNVWAGLMLGLSYINVSPIVNKVILSKTIQSHDEKLNELLLISKEEFKLMKKQNAFIV